MTSTPTSPERGDPSIRDLEARLARLRWSLIGLSLAVVGLVVWIALRPVDLPPVITAERLDIVEPDGNLAFALANSQRPAVATIDGEVLMAGQEEERRGVPSLIFFDGKGDEVGGMLMGVRTSEDGFSATRHLSLDAYKQDQTIVLAHHQSPEGSTSGLRISDRPDMPLPEVLGELGLEPGASRDEMQAAFGAMPEEGRAERLQELFGVSRMFVGTGRDGSATLEMRDGQGRRRVVITVPEDGDPTFEMLDAEGTPVLTLPAR